MADRHGPYRNARFLLEIGGIVKAGFVRCKLPDSRTEPITYREGTDPPTPRKLWSITRYGDLVLESGVTDGTMELFEWRELVERGDVDEARRDIGLVLLDEEGEQGSRWEFHRCWPRRYAPGPLDAEDDQVAIERLEICVQRMERVA